MSPSDLDTLISILQQKTALGRISLSEIRLALAVMQGAGYTITPPAADVS